MLCECLCLSICYHTAMSTNNTFKAVECASRSETGCSTETQFRYSRLSNTPVVVRAVEGQASESSLDIKAALILRACVCSCHTFINIWVQKTKRNLNVPEKLTQVCNRHVHRQSEDSIPWQLRPLGAKVYPLIGQEQWKLPGVL